MTHTPDDPTKAQVWITKGIDDLDFEFYFPQGPKGDPGGLVDGTLLGDVSLDGIKTFGMYRQNNGALATGINKYPANAGGSLMVHGIDANYLMQTYMPLYGGLGSSRVIYRREFITPDWLPWRAFSSTRVDQTAGRAIYQWDDVNNREQLIYGDTGWRDVTSLAGVGWASGSMYVRRVGYSIEIQLDNVTLSGNPNGTIISLPVGFRPTWNAYIPAIHGASRNSRSFFTGSNGSHGFNNAVAAEVMSWRFSYTTGEAWPTTLPGTAWFTIPNL